MHTRFFAVLFSVLLFAGLTGCSSDLSSPDSPEQDTMYGLSSDGTYDGIEFLQNGELSHYEITPIESGATLQEEHYSCNWTIDCDSGSPSYDFYRDVGGSVCIGYSTTICDWTGGNLALAIALYWPGTSGILDYVMLTEDYDHGYVPPSPPGGCWLLSTYITYSIPGGIQGDFPVDWASAVNHGTQCPPLNHFCGWPLSLTPDPFTVHL